MSKVIETTVFEFNELSEGAKEVARDWYRECITSDDYDFECVIDNAVAAAEVLGITINTRGKYGHELYWDLSSGGSVAFNGSYSYAKGASKNVRDEYPNDTELHNIADALQKAQRTEFYRLEVTIRPTNRGDGISVSVFRDSEYYGGMADIAQPIHDFCSWVLSNLRREEEWLNSDEAIDENIMANEYTFTESGERKG